jgi:heme exporter protein A
VRYLSSGQLKRAGFARAMASGAPLWLLDEPINALDTASVERLSELIAAHRLAGGAVLAASHLALPGEWRQLELAA